LPSNDQLKKRFLQTALLLFIPTLALAHGEQSLYIPTTDLVFVVVVALILSFAKLQKPHRKLLYLAAIPAIFCAWILTPGDYFYFLNHPLVVITIHFSIELGFWLIVLFFFKRSEQKTIV